VNGFDRSPVCDAERRRHFARAALDQIAPGTPRRPRPCHRRLGEPVVPTIAWRARLEGGGPWPNSSCTASPPGPAGAQEVALQGFAVDGLEDPRHLHEPGGGVSAQERDQPVAALSAEPTERIQHRPIGFPGPVGLDTLSLRDPHARPAAARARKAPPRPSCRCRARRSRTLPGTGRATPPAGPPRAGRARVHGRRGRPGCGIATRARVLPLPATARTPPLAPAAGRRR
jgi:hypothetical protein